MQKRHALRWAFAIVTALITSWIGLSGINAHAEAPIIKSATCTRSDIAVFRDLMEYPKEEATPAYTLAISEAFLVTCSTHPDARQIHLQAAEAALYSGHALSSIRHFEAAQTYGYTLTIKDRFAMIAALLANGKDAEAWQERDAMIEVWIAALEDDGLADIKIVGLPHGTLYEIRFDAAEEETRIRAVWLTVPDGPGWPAAVSLGSNRFRAAMHALRADEGAERLEHLDFIRCRSRYTLGKTEGRLPVEEAASAAGPILASYLGEPDRLEWTGENEPIAACIWPQLVLPRPDPWKAVAIN